MSPHPQSCPSCGRILPLGQFSCLHCNEDAYHLNQRAHRRSRSPCRSCQDLPFCPAPQFGALVRPCDLPGWLDHLDE